MDNYDNNSFKGADSLRGWSGEHNKIQPAPDKPKHRNKKDTKRWCKGVPGREHKAVWLDHRVLSHWSRGEKIDIPVLPELLSKEERERRKNQINWHWAILYCTTCGKHIKSADTYDLLRKNIVVLTELPAN